MARSDDLQGTEVPIGRDTGEVPLVVDLDGTLVRSDTLWEGVFCLLAVSPWSLFLMPLWLLRGKAGFKSAIAARVDLDVEHLPYHQGFLEFLRAEQGRGRRLLLATGSDRLQARSVADFLNLFEHVMGSDARRNLSGAPKLQAIRDALGGGEFDYAGNARVDLQVWAGARRAILVNPVRGLEQAARRLTTVETVFDDRASLMGSFGRALRLHQWVKNLLLFIPLFAAHQATNALLLWDAVQAFLAMGLCASSVYLLNDLLDLSADRRHPRKCRRPLARGDLSIATALLLIPCLLAFSVVLAWPLGSPFLAALAVYYVTTLTYSLVLKRHPIVDVLVLASLYTLRVVAGALAVGVVVSFWLFAFSMFIFLSLAMVKRYSELAEHVGNGGNGLHRRGYQETDLEVLLSLGTAAGYLSVLVFAMYINSPEVLHLYRHAQWLWLICPLLLYWTSRTWLLARRGEMQDDPIVYALSDRHSLLVAVLCVLTVVGAS